MTVFVRSWAPRASQLNRCRDPRHGVEGSGVQYQSDYILRLIEQMGSLIRSALARIGVGGGDAESLEEVERAVGLALELEPEVARRLSPDSLASLIEIGMTDDRVLELVVQALEVEAEILERNGEIIDARLRRAQADAVRALLDPERAN